jgi:hypothetical protein
MSDSWLKIVGNLFVAADEYIEFLNEQPKKKDTEPVHTEKPKKTGKAGDLGSGICRHPSCGKPIHLTSSGEMNVYWVHSETGEPQCSLFATPQG